MEAVAAACVVVVALVVVVLVRMIMITQYVLLSVGLQPLGLRTLGEGVVGVPTISLLKWLAVAAEAAWSSSSGYVQWGTMAIPQLAVPPVQLVLFLLVAQLLAQGAQLEPFQVVMLQAAAYA